MADPTGTAYAAFRYIGRHRRAVEHRRFVTGQGHFAADVQLPGLLHVAIDARANVWPLVPPNNANSTMLDSNPAHAAKETSHALPA